MFPHGSILLVALVAVLVLTAPRPSSGARGEERYVVRPGETLWELAAERFAGDPRAGIWEIQKRNGLADARLEPGVVLYLPAREGDA